MMTAPRARSLSRMAFINLRVDQRIDLALGFVGLFLIGVIGWVWDRVTVRWTPHATYDDAIRPREHPVRSAQGEHAALLRK
jgi:hypothetical protein